MIHIKRFGAGFFILFISVLILTGVGLVVDWFAQNPNIVNILARIGILVSLLVVFLIFAYSLGRSIFPDEENHGNN